MPHVLKLMVKIRNLLKQVEEATFASRLFVYGWLDGIAYER